MNFATLADIVARWRVPPRGSTIEQPIPQRAILRLIAPSGVYETETGFTFTQSANGNCALLALIIMERDFAFDAIEVRAGAFHYAGSVNRTIILNAGDTLTIDKTLTIVTERRSKQ